MSLVTRISCKVRNRIHVQVSTEFKKATTEPIALVLYSIHEGLVEIDEYRNVYVRT